eukprot:907899-Rhodomonas_salina.1
MAQAMKEGSGTGMWDPFLIRPIDREAWKKWLAEDKKLVSICIAFPRLCFPRNSQPRAPVVSVCSSSFMCQHAAGERSVAMLGDDSERENTLTASTRGRLFSSENSKRRSVVKKPRMKREVERQSEPNLLLLSIVCCG